MNKRIFFKIDKSKDLDPVVSNKTVTKNSSPVQELIKFIYALSEKDVTEFNTSDEKEHALTKLQSIYINNLNTNMRVCYDYIMGLDETVANNDLKKKVFKLYDHIALEYARIAYWASHKEEINRQLIDTKDSIVNISKQSKELSDNVNSAKKEAENLKASQVTVLGIFISILVGLLGQVYIVGKSLSGVTNGENLGPLLILIIVASVCTISAVVALLYIVAKIIDKDLLSKCPKSNTCNTCSNCIVTVQRIKYRLPYLYGFYQIAIALLLLVIIIFYIPWNNISDWYEAIRNLCQSNK